MKPSRLLLILVLIIFSVAACGGNNPEPASTNTGNEEANSSVETEPAVEEEEEETETAEEPSTPTPEPTPEPDNAIGTLQDVQNAVVRIVAEGSFVDPEEGFLLNTAGSGTGFIIDESGIAVTNNHVVTGAALLRVYVPGETEPRNARVLGASECSDLAVIDIDGDDFSYLNWYEGDISTGLDVYAAGYPLGDPEFTLTRGIVSKERASGFTNWSAVEAVIEHDATINPGNSGGPLVTADGQVVAVNYASNPNYNQYFAIARDEALQVIEELRAGNDYESIGVNGVAVSDGAGLSGIWVSSVKSGSPADAAGLEGGDIIVQLEGLVLATDGTMDDYCRILRSHDPDATLSLDVLRYFTGEVLEGQLNGDDLVVVGGSSPGGNGGESPPSNTGALNYVTVYDDTGALQMNVPDTWSDTNGSSWERDGAIVGAALSASPDLEGYRSTFSTPGVFFGASTQLAAQHTEAQFLDQLTTWEDYCTYEGRFDYDDGYYTGLYDLYSDCDTANSVLMNLAVKDPDQTHLAYVQIQSVTEQDDEALQQILDTFIASGDLGGGSTGGGTSYTSGDIVYSTEFDSVGDWSAFTVPDGGTYLAEGRGSTLYIEVPETDSTVYAVQDETYLADVRLDAAVETVAGPNRNNISLVCRYTDAGWYEFSMNSGGYWYIWMYESGEGFSVLAEGASTEINLQKAKNELIAFCSGNDLTFYVNGSEIGSATDTTFTEGGVGISVTTFDIAGAGVEFDWFIASIP